MIRKCEVCGKDFTTFQSRIDKGYGRFCSRKCCGISQRNRIVLECPECHRSFEIRKGSAKKGRKYCSRECRTKVRQRRVREKNNHPKRGHRSRPYIINCALCGKEFRITTYQKKRGARYCSHECLSKSRTTRVWRKCELCHGKFEVHLSHLKRGGGRFCCNSCRYTYMIGENATFWIDGSSPYPSAWTKTLKESIRLRDDYQCQVCGIRQRKKAHDVHHIDYNKFNCRPENLITLCESCHGTTNGDRVYWQDYFTRLMDGKATWVQLGLGLKAPRNEWLPEI